jgi:hypothetical protein
MLGIHHYWLFIGTAIVLAMIGCLLVYSATFFSEPGLSTFKRQIIWVCIGLVLAIIILTVDYHVLFDVAPILYGIGIVLLLYLLLWGQLTANVKFDVAPGPRARIGAINVVVTPREGESQSISNDAVKSTLGFGPGDLYRERELEGAKRALYLSQAYRHVEIGTDTASLRPEGDSTIDVNITLAENPGQVFSRLEIMEELWQSEFSGDVRACDVHISNLRQKIEQDPQEPELVLTVRGVGYRLAEPE